MASLTAVVGLLQERDARQSARWAPLIHRHSVLVAQMERMRTRNAQLEHMLRNAGSGSPAGTPSGGMGGGGASSGSATGGLNGSSSAGDAMAVAQLQAKANELNAELNDRYKELLNTQQALRAAEEGLAGKESELEAAKARICELEAQLERMAREKETSDVTSMALGDELRLLQMELIRVEEANSKLKEENEELVSRWLQKAAEDAEKLNEANMFYQSMVSQRESLELQAAAVSNVTGTVDMSGSGESLLDAMAGASSSSGAYSGSGFVVVPTRARRTVAAHGGEGHSVGYAPNSDMLATGGSDKAIKLFDARSGEHQFSLRGYSAAVYCTRFSPTGEFVLGASADESIRVFDVATQRPRHTLTGHTAKIYAADFSTDGSLAVSGSHDRTLKVWDLARGYCSRTIMCYSSCNDVSVSIDSGVVASGHHNGTVAFWDTRSGDVSHMIKGAASKQVTCVEYSPDGDSLLINSRDNCLTLFDTRTHQVAMTYEAQGFSTGLNYARATFSPDGAFVAAGSASGEVYVWNAASGALTTVLEGGHTAAVACVAWRPSGRSLASLSRDGGLVVWE
ncbi:autophagy protein [Thecamonas trahens ATCC 50062]|uniref:Autophagy protein n=1 Tax=Thecamonas trahens ATCC 50062 TaxID=461836 RepID=A0A0L0D6Q4_THETB|nr:autophagy protein [Thecamonas trahens ATCC 50062]KNC47880.1 autophagy protein [Thecamonas trahens ATCC 50062]|eukprot:XP_013759358.1 autophagy protein [Thecamonas trahens ATCC 50062]